jgi:hypothetical protein
MEQEKIYYLPGDICEIKQNIPNKPVMVVKKKITKMIRPVGPPDIKRDFLQGIVCYWFTDNGFYQENIFSTKDLRKL